MKNVILVFCVLALLGFIVYKGEKPVDALRLRVLANSDSAPDQEEKMQVVKKMEAFFDNACFKSIEEAEEWILENFSEIESALVGFEAQVTLCDEYYNAEYKNGIYYPEGEYRSLVIRLREGRGHNFWGTLFPEIAISTSSAPNGKQTLFTFVKDGVLIEVGLFFVDFFLDFF